MTWNRLQSKSATSGTLTAAATLGSALTAGSKLLAFVVCDGTATLSTVKDGSGNSFTSLTSITGGGATPNVNYGIFVCDTATSTTITLTTTGTANGCAILVQEVTGLATGTTTTACYDGTAGTATHSNQTLAAGGTAVSLGAYTSTLANEFLVIMWGDSGDTVGSTGTTPSGYTADANNTASDTNDGIRVYYKNSTGGTESPTTVTAAGASNNFGVGTIFVAFKLAAAGGAGPVPYPYQLLSPGRISPAAFPARPQPSPPPPPTLTAPVIPPLVPPGYLSPLTIAARPQAPPPFTTSSAQAFGDVGAAVDDGGMSVSATVDGGDDVAAATDLNAVSVTATVDGGDDVAGAVDAMAVTTFTAPAPPPAIPPGIRSPMALSATIPPPPPFSTTAEQDFLDAAAATDLNAVSVSATVDGGDDVGAAVDDNGMSVTATVDGGDDVAGAVDAMTIAVLAAGTPPPPPAIPPGFQSPLAFSALQPQIILPTSAVTPVPQADVGAAIDSVTVTYFTQPVLPPLVPPGIRSPMALTAVLPPPPPFSTTAEQDFLDVAAATDQTTVAATVDGGDDVGAATDAVSVSAMAPQADVAAAVESLTENVTAPQADVGAAVDTMSVVISIAPADVAGAIDAMSITVTAPMGDVAGATDTTQIIIAGAFTGTLKWMAEPALPRWLALPVVRWRAEPRDTRWETSPRAGRWAASPAQSRWRIIMTAFPSPISALSLEEVNATWTSDLDGTTIDPTGQTTGQPQLPVQMAFPVSSGDVTHPTPPSTWYTAGWLTGGTGKGYVAQCLVGPGGGQTALTAGKYDVHSKITGAPEVPVKFVGVLTVY